MEVLEDVTQRHTPAPMALRDWGKAHRFAGSKDRAAIGNYVHDVLRRRSSLGHRMGDDNPRALVLRAAVDRGLDPAALAAAFVEDKFAPDPMTDAELARLNDPVSLDAAEPWVRADVPEWLWPAFENNFGDEAVAEAQALTARPPLDLRVNTIRSDVEKALPNLDASGAKPTAISPIGLRIPAAEGDGRLPNVQVEPVYQRGEVEIQDEGSQLVSLLVAAKPGEHVLDYCAGGGGKSLALAADMGNEGTVYAYDIDKRRLAPVFERARRAGADIVEVRQPPTSNLSDLIGKMDRVLIDAPCTGVGTWRRKPDAKWRLKPESLDLRLRQQRQVLDEAKDYVRPRGLLFYVTCSILAEENEGQVYPFLEANPDFTLLSAGEVWEERFGTDKPKPWSEDGLTVTLSPLSTGTDGFFFSVMERAA